MRYCDHSMSVVRLFGMRRQQLAIERSLAGYLTMMTLFKCIWYFNVFFFILYADVFVLNTVVSDLYAVVYL